MSTTNTSNNSSNNQTTVGNDQLSTIINKSDSKIALVWKLILGLTVLLVWIVAILRLRNDNWTLLLVVLATSPCTFLIFNFQFSKCIIKDFLKSVHIFSTNVSSDLDN